MIRVPAGEFLYGEKKIKLHLDAFWMAKTPVTSAEYKRFLDANSDYAVPFRDADWAKRYNWDRERRTFPPGKGNHPVVLVSWHDAQAYAKWAGLALPTEQQWEKAARGTDGRQYPWGNEWRANHCNISKSGIRATTPAGQFSPQGDSVYGCVDMAGNVWEWTASEWSSGSSSRALRGGSWDDTITLSRLARVAERYGRDPDFADYFIGFRLVAPSVSPIVWR
jgi:formylglycine-generating enzyme required for sulfatase activity